MENYYIIASDETDILAMALCQVAKPLASVRAETAKAAHRHLFAVAVVHFLSKSR